jgi:hypothetical protein
MSLCDFQEHGLLDSDKKFKQMEVESHKLDLGRHKGKVKDRSSEI